MGNLSARMHGYYYNTIRGPGSGQDYNKYEGDVFVQNRLKYHSNGTLSANAFVHRSDDENESLFTELFSYEFPIPINLDIYYTLSIRLEDEKLIFACNDETVEYNITTPIYPAYGMHRTLRSRIEKDPSRDDYFQARFDDVYTGDPIDFCQGDFDEDGDVDGDDITTLAGGSTDMSIKSFAFNFGKYKCSSL